MDFLETNSISTPKNKHSYYRELKRLLETSYVIIEVLDARDPLGCRCKDIELRILGQLSSSLKTSKKIILILNKIDLVPAEVVSQWLKYFRREFPTLAFKSSTQEQRNLSRANVPSALALSTSQCVGAEGVIQLLKNYCRNQNIKTSITVGIVGYPNVGKSSFINSLKRVRSVAVAPTPGCTKTLQRVRLDKNIILVDSPGVIFGEQDADSLLLRNCIKLEQVDDLMKSVTVLLTKVSTDEICKVFMIPRFTSIEEFLMHVANKRGKLLKGGVPDLNSAARVVLQEWITGALPYYTLPPATEDTHAQSAIVTSWGKEFDMQGLVNEADRECLTGLNSIHSKVFIPVKSSEMNVDPNFNNDVDEDDDMDAEIEDVDGEEFEEEEDDEEMEVEEVEKPKFVLNEALLAKKMKKGDKVESKKKNVSADDAVNMFAENKQKKDAKKAQKDQRRAINREKKKLDN